MEKNIMRRKKDFTKLPESELQIMQLIWDMDKKGVKDIHAGALLAAYRPLSDEICEKVRAAIGQ